ncbi:MAG: hypothetical protein AAGC83_04760 [Pseudomonadota bacterium]
MGWSWRTKLSQWGADGMAGVSGATVLAFLALAVMVVSAYQGSNFNDSPQPIPYALKGH